MMKLNFAWADGKLDLSPSLHHFNLLQRMGATAPRNTVGGYFDSKELQIVWRHGNAPDNEQILFLIRQEIERFEERPELTYPKIAATVEDTEPEYNFGFLTEPHDELYPCAFTGDKMDSEAIAKIKSWIIPDVLDGPGWDEFIYFTVYGSGASYNWDEDGDFDVQMWVDIEKYNAKAKEPKTSDELLDEVRRHVQTLNFPSFQEVGLETDDCSGRMLIQYYPKLGTGSEDENLASKPYACYDMDADKWLQKPEPITPEFYGQMFLLVEDKATDIAKQAEQAIASLQRSVVNWQFWTAMYSAHQEEAYQEEADKARGEAMLDQQGVMGLFEGVFGGRAEAYSEKGEGYKDERDIVQKYLEVWGIFQKLKHFARAPLPWDEQEMPEEPKTTKTAAEYTQPAEWDPKYAINQNLPMGGTFGFLNGHLILGSTHHKGIMGALIDNGWTWTDLMGAEQAWGWFYPKLLTAGQMQWVELRFTSDSGLQHPEAIQQALQAMADYYKVPTKKMDDVGVRGVEHKLERDDLSFESIEDAYGTGLMQTKDDVAGFYPSRIFTDLPSPPVTGSVKTAAKWEKDYWRDKGLRSYGCFGFINGQLLLGDTHHQQIMGKLLDAGWTWADLMTVPQAWGWYEVAQQYQRHPDEPGEAWPVMTVRFTSDAGVQNEEETQKAMGAFSNLYHMPTELQNAPTRGITIPSEELMEELGTSAEDYYGKGLRGKEFANRYLDGGERHELLNQVRGELPPAPGQPDTRTWIPEPKPVKPPTIKTKAPQSGIPLVGQKLNFPNNTSNVYTITDVGTNDLTMTEAGYSAPYSYTYQQWNHYFPEWIPVGGLVVEGSVKEAVKYEPEYWRTVEPKLRQHGCFGWIGGELLLGSKHHQQIMAALIDNGWTWMDLMQAEQAWGWYDVHYDSPKPGKPIDAGWGEGSNYWPTVHLTFVSDSGIQNEDAMKRAAGAFASLYHIPAKIKGEGHGIKEEETYGKGLKGIDYAKHYEEGGQLHHTLDNIRGEFPPAPGQPDTRTWFPEEKPEPTPKTPKTKAQKPQTGIPEQGQHFKLPDYPYTTFTVHFKMPHSLIVISDTGNTYDLTNDQFLASGWSPWIPTDTFQPQAKTAAEAPQFDPEQAYEGCFGFIGGQLLLGYSHHQEIMGALMKAGWTWMDLMTAKQTWGWYDGEIDYDYDTGNIDQENSYINLSFTSDAGKQHKTMIPKTITAFKRGFGIKNVTQDSYSDVRGVRKKDYGVGLGGGGTQNVENYASNPYQLGVSGEIPPPPVPVDPNAPKTASLDNQSGCFGFINGALLLGDSHHQEIMGALMKEGWTWTDLMQAPQLWGWYETDDQGYYDSETDDYVDGENDVISVRFTSDAGTQSPELFGDCQYAFEKHFPDYLIDLNTGYTRGVKGESDYGAGLGGSGPAKVERYRDNGAYAWGDPVPPPPRLTPPPAVPKPDWVPEGLEQVPTKIKHASVEQLEQWIAENGPIFYHLSSKPGQDPNTHVDAILTHGLKPGPGGVVWLGSANMFRMSEWTEEARGSKPQFIVDVRALEQALIDNVQVDGVFNDDGSVAPWCIFSYAGTIDPEYISLNPEAGARRTAGMDKFAKWGDIMEKAKRIMDGGRVQIQVNEPTHVVGQVQGDTGNYQTEIWRDDPSSQSITMWDCTCPWSSYSWGRTRQWKKYEGRPCAHTMALFWQAQKTPVSATGQPPTPVPTPVPGGDMAPTPAVDGLMKEFDPSDLIVPFGKPQPIDPNQIIPLAEPGLVPTQIAPQAPQTAPVAQQGPPPVSVSTTPKDLKSPLGIPGAFSKVAMPGKSGCWICGRRENTQFVTIPVNYGAKKMQVAACPKHYDALASLGEMAMETDPTPIDNYKRQYTGHNVFKNGDIVRARVTLFGEEPRTGEWHEVPQNSGGEVLFADSQEAVVIFPLGGGQLTPHLIKVFCTVDDLYLDEKGQPFIKRHSGSDQEAWPFIYNRKTDELEFGDWMGEHHTIPMYGEAWFDTLEEAEEYLYATLVYGRVYPNGRVEVYDGGNNQETQDIKDEVLSHLDELRTSLAGSTE